MPLGLGIWEILILAGVLLLLFGAKGAPAMARRLGTGVKEMKDAVTEMDPRSILDPKDKPAEAPQRQLEATKAVPVAAPPRGGSCCGGTRCGASGACSGRARDARGRIARELMDVVSYRTLEPFTTKDGSTIREYLHSPAQSLAEATLEPGQSTMRHYHALSEEIYLLIGGAGTMEIDGEAREVAEGDAILIPPGAWHELLAGSEGVRLLCCCVPPYSHDDTYFA